MEDREKLFFVDSPFPLLSWCYLAETPGDTLLVEKVSGETANVWDG